MTTRVEAKPKLKLIGTDGNAFALLGRAHKAAKFAKWPNEKWESVFGEARSGDYNHLLQTLMEHFEVE